MFEMNEKRREVFNLGLVSLFNDLSSEVVIRVLPLYLIVVIRTTFIGIGVVEAIAESTATLGKLFSGYYSDKKGRRKPLIFLGYGLSVISRPLILLQPTLVVTSLSRFADKIGKSIRTPPRDALIADLSAAGDRGRNFGINRALDTLGAVMGLACVFVFLHFNHSTESTALKTILNWACGIGAATLVVLWFGVKEPPRENLIHQKKLHLSFSSLDRRIRYYLFIGFFFALATSSDAFIIVRLRELGFSIGNIFLILTGFNIVSASTAFSLGKLSDLRGRKNLLMAGWAIYAAAYFIFGFSHSLVIFTIVFLVYGLFYSLTDGIEKALIADFVSEDQRGQAYGWLGLVQGLAVIPANLIFASIYQKIGADWAFRSSAIFALIGIVSLSFLNPRKEKELQ